MPFFLQPAYMNFFELYIAQEVSSEESYFLKEIKEVHYIVR